MAMPRRLTSAAVRGRKGTRFPVVTAYDAPFARCAEEAGFDVILVGDSLGMVVLGYDSTTHVTLDDMCRHVGAVGRGTAKAHVIADMPFGSYETSDAHAIGSTVTLVRAGASSVKLEGGVNSAPRIAAIVRAGIPVVGHIGVLPQTAALAGGFRRKSDAEALLADAHAVAEAGAFAVVLEMVDAAVAARITEELEIPTIGIGAGAQCDAQVLVMHDVLGLYPHAPPFAKRYGELAVTATEALRAYAEDVRAGVFPPAKTDAAQEADAAVYAVSSPIPKT
jgi:3-methyl-2-oxobutanoate hydroxymethyltransferase